MLKRLIRALDDERFDIYVHIDARSKIKEFRLDELRLKNAGLFVLQERQRVHWGGYSQINATMKMYREALKLDEYIRYVTLTGIDYPLKSNDVIYQILSDTSKEFIMGKPLKLYKVQEYYFQDHGFIGQCFSTLFRRMGIKHNKKGLIVDGQQYAIYFSPAYHALSRDCVREIFDTIDRNNHAVQKYFRYTFASDESLIPTMVFNSSFKDNTLKYDFPINAHYNEMPSIHYIDYSGWHPKVFDIGDYDALMNSGKLFARKFRTETSNELLDFIDKTRN